MRSTQLSAIVVLVQQRVRGVYEILAANLICTDLFFSSVRSPHNLGLFSVKVLKERFAQIIHHLEKKRKKEIGITISSLTVLYY